ncbi:MAG: hypothetical protein L0215_19305 [Gemmataceae bacterium]|nr:hypothetical protein [Gemmataceae bacterium]
MRMTILIVFVAMLLGGVSVPERAIAQDAELQKKINNAIDRGVHYLKEFEVGQREERRLGAIALIGWTLLESGCTAQDAKVKEIAEEVRQLAIGARYTYSLSLAIIFLDKLGDGGDLPILDTLTLRLLAGQSKEGGWNYHCPNPNEQEQQRLRQLVADMKAKRDKGEKLPVVERDLKELTKDWQRQWQTLVVGPQIALDISVEGDNSNTQFAMMAVWVARRHGLPVQQALATVEKRFRDSQRDGGEWGYTTAKPPPVPPGVKLNLPGQDSDPSMTCAGLLGLALGQGLKNQAKDLAKDPVAKKGLAYLEKQLDEGVGPNAGPVKLGGNIYYYLFSMERMAVVYDLKKIGKNDWYVEGAKYLIAAQGVNGGWSGKYTEYGSDTCFALLFLKRANVAEDLTEILTGIVRKKAPDPPRKKIDDKNPM